MFESLQPPAFLAPLLGATLLLVFSFLSSIIYRDTSTNGIWTLTLGILLTPTPLIVGSHLGYQTILATKVLLGGILAVGALFASIAALGYVSIQAARELTALLKEESN